MNLPLLVAHLETFDGWALSTSASALRDVWNLCPSARCAAWSKTWTVNGWSRVRWTWEPVLFRTDRKGLDRYPDGTKEMSTTWDSLVCAPEQERRSWSEIPGKGGGSKPYEFVRWILDLLDYDAGDEFVDLFPGSGAVARAVALEVLELDLEVGT